ncbi:hypothetical protein AURDEDRAFT_179766 [Auricularia subglabra TFB-10046 SS5]|nr:hypothetical protein AURDEDRAFT_179766 [Auricularia subglabra TFB-10046 SS5]
MRLPALCALVSGALVAVAAKVSVDDTDPSIVYASPGEDWTRHVDQAASYELYNDSDTFTSVRGATITWKFRGTSVEYWGNTGPYHGPCSVAVNGVAYGNISSNAAKTGPPIALFVQQGLPDDSEHTIVIRVMAASYPNVCELDRFVYEPVETKSTTTGSRPSETPGSQSGASKSSSSSQRWAIIGGAIGGTIGAIILVLTLGACYCQRKRSKIAKDEDEAFKFPPGMPTLPVITPMSEPPSPFVSRPITATPPSMPSRPLSVGSSVYMGGVPPGLGGPIATQRASAVYDGPPSGVFMPVPHPADRRRPVSTYGSESHYLPSPTASSMAGRPLLSRTSTQSSLSAPAGTRPLSPGRPQYVLSAASELGEPEADAPAGAWPGDVKVKPKEPVIEKNSVSPPSPAEGSSSLPAASASTSVPPTAPAEVPVVQHTDAGAVTEPAAAHTPEELPPAYNEQWSGAK